MLTFEHNKILLKTPKFIYIGRIDHASYGYFFAAEGKISMQNREEGLVYASNNAIFKDYSLNTTAIFMNTIGYIVPCEVREWPWCNTQMDVLSVLKALDKMLNNEDKNFIDLRYYF